MPKRLIRLTGRAICLIFVLTAKAEVVYLDGMETTTNGWNEDSNATDEPGDSTGRIQIVGGDKFQMNSWWDGAGYISIWKIPAISFRQTRFTDSRPPYKVIQAAKRSPSN